MEPEFSIGTQFTKRGDKAKAIWTVVDILTTYNFKGEPVKLRFVAEKPYMGQMLTDYDVLDITIAMGLIEQRLHA